MVGDRREGGRNYNVPSLRVKVSQVGIVTSLFNYFNELTIKNITHHR